MPGFSFVGAYLWTQQNFEGKNNPFWGRNFQLKIFPENCTHWGASSIFARHALDFWWNGEKNSTKISLKPFKWQLLMWLMFLKFKPKNTKGHNSIKCFCQFLVKKIDNLLSYLIFHSKRFGDILVLFFAFFRQWFNACQAKIFDAPQWVQFSGKFFNWKFQTQNGLFLPSKCRCVHK